MSSISKLQGAFALVIMLSGGGSNWALAETAAAVVVRYPGTYFRYYDQPTVAAGCSEFIRVNSGVEWAYTHAEPVEHSSPYGAYRTYRCFAQWVYGGGPQFRGEISEARSCDGIVWRTDAFACAAWECPAPSTSWTLYDVTCSRPDCPGTQERDDATGLCRDKCVAGLTWATGVGSCICSL